MPKRNGGRRFRVVYSKQVPSVTLVIFILVRRLVISAFVCFFKGRRGVYDGSGTSMYKGRLARTSVSSSVALRRLWHGERRETTRAADFYGFEVPPKLGKKHVMATFRSLGRMNRIHPLLLRRSGASLLLTVRSVP